jgi:hypothetical protein
MTTTKTNQFKPDQRGNTHEILPFGFVSNKANTDKVKLSSVSQYQFVENKVGSILRTRLFLLYSISIASFFSSVFIPNTSD